MPAWRRFSRSGPGGCAAPLGDFGRPEPNIINDTFLPYLGREMARGRGEPVSYYMLTDDETELRRRTYRRVMPIHRKAFLARSEPELVRTRIWPDEKCRVDPTLYYRKLVADHFRLSVGRWSALKSDILADTPLIERYCRVAERICAADAARLSALAGTPGLTAEEEADATGRVHENRRVMAWAVAGLRWRVESYAYALQRSRLEIPSPAEVSVDIALDRLSRKVEAFAAAVGTMCCDGTAGAGVVAGGPVYKR